MTKKVLIAISLSDCVLLFEQILNSIKQKGIKGRNIFILNNLVILQGSL